MSTSVLKTPSAVAVAAKLDKSRNRAERRVSHRVPCRVRASDTLQGKGICVVGQTVNLSANGLAVQVGRSMAEGTSVEVLLPPLDGEPTRLQGRVAHSRRVLSGTFEIGIRVEAEGEQF